MRGLFVARARSCSSSVPANASNYKTIPFQTTRKNAGTPNSTDVTKNASGQVIEYGNKYITYKTPRARSTNSVRRSSWRTARRVTAPRPTAYRPRPCGAYPDLVGLGPATIDFWVDSGRMPAKDPDAVEAPRRQPALNPQQAEAIAAWVNSLSPSYPGIPTANLKDANVVRGPGALRTQLRGVPHHRR